MLCPVFVAQDIERGGQCFGAVKPPRASVICGVGGDEVGEEAFVLPADFGPGDFGNADPGAFDDGGAVGFEEGAVKWGD